MALHKLNPHEGEVWHHPLTHNSYRIHSVTTDGWVRYFPAQTPQQATHPYPYYTQPTLEFISKYERHNNG